MSHQRETLEPIAVIGLACRFPGGANSPDELWRLLAEGTSGWSEIPADRYNWRSFHHPYPDAEAALGNAGIPLHSVKGSKTSVHVATVSRDYDPITSGRVSYTFDLRGPCFSLDTGYSGRMVGLHLAVQGQCYAFDSRGKGYARSEGVSTIALKRLSDAVGDGDPIRAIVINTGINQNGKANGIMLPNSHAQEDLMRSGHLDAGLEPSLTAYVEARGTGTHVGDKAEMNSIYNVLCAGIERDQPLFVGSIKANIGHCGSASGFAGLIKTILALEKGLIPATPNVMDIKDELNVEERNIRIPQRLEQWRPLSVRRAAVNSFGYGGTNAVATLEGYELPVPSQ
ncbi:phenolpthiocerol synthesis polyketide synthase ppsa [Xylaria cf. heliscus]|nr:phenolpthiocerol synthesis polyketide synthase ppsa [Xylaria cf. heliscus]